MESAWLLILIALSCIAATLLLLLAAGADNRKRRLPPGPLAVPLLGNLLWLRHSIKELDPLLRSFHATYGPILTLRIGSRPAIFISDHSLTHTALISHGAAFSDRPAPLPSSRFLSNNQHNISSAAYGPLWRLLRRNLSSEILSSSRVNLYSPGRRWVLSLLSHHLHSKAVSTEEEAFMPMPFFQFAMFCLLVLMCFGEKLDEKAIRDIETAQRNFLLHVGKLNVFAFVPKFAHYIFRQRWATAVAFRKRQLDLYAPLIKARRQHKRGGGHEEDRYVHSYLDSLLDIQLPEGGRGLTDEEIVGLCSEFLNAGTDTTSTALQWIMAELVKHPSIQTKLLDEIESVAAEKEGEVKEEELQRMPYLRAVVMEGLRRHPPAHYVLPHAVTEEITIGGYVIPKDASVNFMVAKMNWDEKVWEEPMEFKPERFLVGGAAEGVDITGSREVRMMPFGVGRRICPGLGLAMLHLEYFVANLVREFEWKKVEGEEVDMSEKLEFTVVMKKPLRACIVPRRKT